MTDKFCPFIKDKCLLDCALFVPAKDKPPGEGDCALRVIVRKIDRGVAALFKSSPPK